MIKDLLKREERIRLEALNQANQFAAMRHDMTGPNVVAKAVLFEEYIRRGANNVGVINPADPDRRV